MVQGTNRIDYVAWCQSLRLEDMPAMAKRILECLKKEEGDPQGQFVGCFGGLTVLSRCCFLGR